MKVLKKGLIIAVLMVAAFMLSAVTPVAAASQDKVRVWVSYQSDRKAEVFQALDKAKATILYDFPELESYVVSLPEAALKGIVNNPHVVDVEADPARYPVADQQSSLASALEASVGAEGQVVPWGIDAVQARDVWDEDRDGTVDSGAPSGSGVTVCIIDTGYYTGHEDLENTVSGYSQVASWDTDGVGHGTHVAGTISAANNNLGVVGVIPGSVSLYIVKIFDDSGAWVAASDLVDAIYNCRDNGADVISMSLSGPSSNRKEQRAFDSIYSAGILHVAAASNDGVSDYHYPASYDSVISVGALDENLVVADFSNFNDQVELAAPGVGVLSTIPYIETNSLSVGGVDYSVNHIEFSAYGAASGELVDGGLCNSTGGWSGRVVLCERGDISFYDKVMNVQNSGGAAAIIYNNEPGNFLGTLGDGASSSIIGLSLSQEDGQYLVANELEETASISSIYDWPANGYEAWDGTSMATPHVAGVAALIWSSDPSLTNVEIREAMTTTALDLGDAGRDVYYGFGLVQAKDALTYLGGGSVDDPPSVVLTYPTNGSTVSDLVTVSANAIDDNGVVQVEFFVDGDSIGVDTVGSDGWTASWDTTLCSDGAHTVSAVVTDSIGQTDVDSVSVTVDNGGSPTDPISLIATGYKSRGKKYVDLNWTGATSSSIDVYRDGSLLITIVNDGSYTDGPLSIKTGTTIYMVCETGTSICSNEAAIDW